MKLKYIFITLVVLLMAVLAGIYGYKSGKVLETHQSPDGNYELIVKSAGGLFSSTMPGDGGKSRPVEVVLKDAEGNIIGKSSGADCDTLWFSIDVSWDLENNQVQYAKAKTIHLKTGEVGC